MFPIDFEKCVKKFKEFGKLVEINESSILYKKGSYENSYELLRLCKKYEVPVVFDSDAHYCDLIGVVDTAQKIAQEVDFPEELVINADYDTLLEFIHRKHPEIEFL